MAALPVCARCGKLGVGGQCVHCGAAIEPAAPEEEMVLETTPAATTSGARADRKPAAAYLSLEPSETAVLHAASRIFAAFITSGAVSQGNENELSDRAVQLATRMALVIEKYIQSDREDW